MDFSKLSTNNWIAAGGGLLAVISLFLPWIDYVGVASDSGFGSGFGGLFGLLLVIAAAVVLLLKVFDIQDVKIQGLSAEQLAMVLGALGTLLIVLRILIFDDGGDIGLGRSIRSRTYGMWIGLIAAAATTAGAFLSGKDEGIGLPSADDFSSGDSGDSSGESPSTF